jgi:glutamyl-tRNA reductase
MQIQVVGCNYQRTPIALRERLAFSDERARLALRALRQWFPELEVVLLSTCNRVEFYAASCMAQTPSRQRWAEFLAQFHGIDVHRVAACLFELYHRDAVRHLLAVASSLDSMVIGEPQILAQVKEAYQRAVEVESAGSVLNTAFQTALKTAKLVARKTTIHQHRVSVPSVAIADFARNIFARFDDKNTLVIGAGDMAEETLKYLRDEGVLRITVINRSRQRAEDLAKRWQGTVHSWERLLEAIAAADLVISTTGAPTTIVTLQDYLSVESQREPRPLFILDLAVPRDFDQAIGQRPGVYLYSVDDLLEVSRRNQQQRERELPIAMQIIEEETDGFLARSQHREVGPTIYRLRNDWDGVKEFELERLFRRVPHLDDRARALVRQAFARLVGKLMHAPMESLRDESQEGQAQVLLGALTTLFQLQADRDDRSARREAA